MGWLASFKGLRSVGVPPLFAVLVLAVLFVFFRKRSDDSDAPGTEASPGRMAPVT